MSYTQDLRNIIARIRTVLKGEVVQPEDHNLQTECIKKIADILDEISTITAGKLKLEAYTRYTHSHTYSDGASSFFQEITEHNEDYVINTDNFAHIGKPLLENDILSIDVYFRTWLQGEPGAGGDTNISSNAIIYLYAYDELENILCRSEQVFNYAYKYWITYPGGWQSVIDSRSLSINFIVPKNTYKVRYYVYYYIGLNLPSPAVWKNATIDIREDIRLLR
jgi:hypothetical protein